MLSNKRQKSALLLIFGAVIAIASIFPWISISFVNARGIDGWRGFVTIATGLIICVFGASQLWEGFIDAKNQPYLRLTSIILGVFSVGIFTEIGYKTLNASNQIGDLSSDVDSGLGDFGDSLNQFANSLAEQLNPQLAIGWYLGLIGSVSSLVLLLLRSKVSTTESKVTPIDGSERLETVRVKKGFGKTIAFSSITVLIIVVLSIVIIRSNQNETDGPKKINPYIASLEIRSASRFLSTEVTRQVDKWNGFGYAKYTEWADRFIQMISNAESISDSEEKLSADLASEFSSNEYLNEQKIINLSEKFKSDVSKLQSALNEALVCSISLPKNNECDPQFSKVSGRLGTLKATSDDLASMLQ